MSTADSQLLVAASAVVRDLYEKILHKDESIPQKQLTLLSRLCVVFLVIIAIFLGIVIEDLVFWFVLFAWQQNQKKIKAMITRDHSLEYI